MADAAGLAVAEHKLVVVAFVEGFDHEPNLGIF